jgi:hypothetical protein
MSQAILQTPLKSTKGRKLNRTRQDQMMLQIAFNAVTSIKSARLIFDIAYPQRKRAIPHIPNEVLADLRELRAIQEWGTEILPTDDAYEAQRKYGLTLRIGRLEAKIERAIAHIALPMEDSDE